MQVERLKIELIFKNMTVLLVIIFMNLASCTDYLISNGVSFSNESDDVESRLPQRNMVEVKFYSNFLHLKRVYENRELSIDQFSRLIIELSSILPEDNRKFYILKQFIKNYDSNTFVIPITRDEFRTASALFTTWL